MTALTEGKISRVVAEPSSAEADFRALVDQHVDAVWRTLRRLGLPAADLDDGVQQVFSVLARRRQDVERGRERGYLLGVALRVAADARRSRRRRPELPIEPAELERAPELDASPERLLEQRRELDLLDRLVAELPEPLSEVFVLSELEELTMAEIARLLSIPPGTVASRLRRARELFMAACQQLELSR